MGIRLAMMSAIGIVILLAVATPPAQYIGASLPSSLLDKKELQKHLTSGLTTVIIASVDEKTSAERIRGAVRIEIRNDLWNEVFLVTTIDAGGNRQESKLASLDQLRTWWTSTTFRIAPASHSPPASVHLRVDVIPFSAAEQAEAQRWLVHSMNNPTQSLDDPSPRETQAVSRSLFDMIIATSVQRRPLLSWRGTVPVKRP